MREIVDGGVHPRYEKEQTRGKPIEVIPPPERVIVPLSQHIGTPCDPLVRIGETVRRGQKIGEARGRISAPVHAPISGKVVGIGRFPHPSGNEGPSIVIQSDGKDESVAFQEQPDYLNLEPKVALERVQEAGIVGLGGATFPTHVKLHPPPDKPIEVAILNGAECEPYLTADLRVMVEQTREMLEGLRIIMHILGVKKGYIGIEDDKTEAIQAVSQAIAHDPDIELRTFPVQYPQGSEKQLIYHILKKEVPSGGLPMDVGAVVQNVATAVAIYRAVRFGEPLIDRVVTVSGNGVAEPKNLRVRIGTLVEDLLPHCGGLVGEPGKVIFGGPMMGLSQYTLQVPVVKGTGGVLIFQREEIRLEPSQPCIRCGFCVRVCPIRLLPNMFSVYAEMDRIEEAAQYDIFDCIECGCCAYICPSKRPIVHHIRYVKAQVRKVQAKAGAAGR